MSFRLITPEDIKATTKGDFGTAFDYLLDGIIIPAVGETFAAYCHRTDFDLKARTEFFDIRENQSSLFLSSPPVIPIVTSLRTAALRWVLSSAGAGIYYVELVAGGSASLANPFVIHENGVDMTRNSIAASLAAGQFFYGDVDSLGFTTVYVRLSDSADPDSKALAYVEHVATSVRVWQDSNLPRTYGTELVNGTDFVVYDDQGVVEGVSWFSRGQKAVKCTYTGGYLTGDGQGVPADLRFAAIIQTKILFDRREEFALSSKALEGGSFSLFQPLTLPSSVTKILDRYRLYGND